MSAQAARRRPPAPAERTIPTVAGSLLPSRQGRAKLGMALDLTFMIGSEEAARKAGTNDRCVLVPETALQQTPAPPLSVVRRPVRPPVARTLQV